MAAPLADVHAHRAARVAAIALAVGVVTLILRFIAYYITGSAAVLSDAFEAVLNIVSAAMMLFTIRLSGLPADAEHPYGHGKIESLALGFEGGMILAMGCAIGYVGVHRLIWPVRQLERLDTGTWLVSGIGVLIAALAAFVYWGGRRYNNPILIADAKHLGSDVITSWGVALGLLLVQWTGKTWLDPVIALLLGVLVFATSWGLLMQAFEGLMDYSDPRDIAKVRAVLEDEVRRGTMRSFHKVRVRRTGRYRWIEFHIQVDPALTVRDSHSLASAIEYRIEQLLGPGNATAHIEPDDPEQLAKTL
jgi:cation diffusion facilitator family transporter